MMTPVVGKGNNYATTRLSGLLLLPAVLGVVLLFGGMKKYFTCSEFLDLFLSLCGLKFMYTVNMHP